MIDREAFLNDAASAAQEWIAAFQTDSAVDPWLVFHELRKRMHQGEKVRPLVARSPEELTQAVAALARLAVFEEEIEDDKWDDILRSTQARILGEDWAEERPIGVDVFHPLPNADSEATAQAYIKQASRCVWDPYRLALYSSAYAQLANPKNEFMRQSLLNAARAGLEFYVHLGGYAVGVLRSNEQGGQG